MINKAQYYSPNVDLSLFTLIMITNIQVMNLLTIINNKNTKIQTFHISYKWPLHPLVTFPSNLSLRKTNFSDWHGNLRIVLKHENNFKSLKTLYA